MIERSAVQIAAVDHQRIDFLCILNVIDWVSGKQDEVSRAWRSLLLESFESGALVGPDTPETVVHVEAGGLGVPPQSVTEPQ